MRDRLITMNPSESDVLVHIGRNLKAERARRDLTQEALAGLTGLAASQIARMERGETDSGISKYVRVARAIGISPADLFFGVEEVRLELPVTERRARG